MENFVRWLRYCVRRISQPRRHFLKTHFQTQAPRGKYPREREFLVIGTPESPAWAVFRCPCGCGRAVNLSLRDSHAPHWELVGECKWPTIEPSIWQRVGCKSHFWIRDGFVDWCDTSECAAEFAHN